MVLITLLAATCSNVMLRGKEELPVLHSVNNWVMIPCGENHTLGKNWEVTAAWVWKAGKQETACSWLVSVQVSRRKYRSVRWAVKEESRDALQHLDVFIHIHKAFAYILARIVTKWKSQNGHSCCQTITWTMKRGHVRVDSWTGKETLQLWVGCVFNRKANKMHDCCIATQVLLLYSNLGWAWKLNRVRPGCT